MAASEAEVRLTFSVVVPSYGRPQHLLRCLTGLQAGVRLPEQVVVVLRDSDQRSQQRLDQWCRQKPLGQRVAAVLATEPGQIMAMNRGLAVATGEVVCFTDDDCVPRVEWLAQLASHYQDPTIGGVGGRDVVYHGDRQVPLRQCRVGKVTWAGKIIGNHHCCALNDPIPVDHLKGANMSFRRTLLDGFDPNLTGGSACLNDTEISLSVAAQGFRLIFDPEAIVDHYPAQRFGESTRRLNASAIVSSDSHNWVYCMMKHLPGIRKVAFLANALLVGMGNRYGLIKYLINLPGSPVVASRLFLASTAGKLRGLRTYLAARHTPGHCRGNNGKHGGSHAPA